ncbi:MAG: hypothetical protein RID09_16445 [Coleofasciculus sp. G1-WW12-02]|uniref:hypothetical protein n=1 Tax=Coleofasciculus sp. G1-WW12-02 TaxID=3068483 RepID=UPI0032FB7041
MADIQFEIQGQDAIAATEALFAHPGLEGHWETADEPDKEGTIATIGAIVGIVGGAITIAEQIRKWYQEYQKGKAGKKIDKVLLVKGDRRLLLKDATIEEIRQILED